MRTRLNGVYFRLFVIISCSNIMHSADLKFLPCLNCTPLGILLKYNTHALSILETMSECRSVRVVLLGQILIKTTKQRGDQSVIYSNTILKVLPAANTIYHNIISIQQWFSVRLCTDLALITKAVEQSFHP